MFTAHKRVFYHFFTYMYGRPKVVAGDDASSIDVSVETPLPLSRRKMPNDESSCTSAMANFFCGSRLMVPIIPIGETMQIAW